MAPVILLSGSVQPMLNRNYIANVPISIPPLTEQRGIAATLGALDKKIESNHRVIAFIEDLGAAILDSKLDIDVYGFPSYDDSRRLGDILEVLETGSRPKGGVVVSDVGMVSLGAENVQSAGIVATTAFKRVPHGFAAAMRGGRLEAGDILVYKDGGSPGNFTPHISAFGEGFPVAEATINEHVYRARAGKGVSQGLLYWLLRSAWMDQEMRKRGTGVAIPGLNSANFRELPLPVVNREVVEALNEGLDPLLVAMLRLGAECRRLSTLRDTLLPELLSGRIRVPEAVQTVVGTIA